MQSALYVGRVRHRRFHPVRRDFTYSLGLFWLDLAELDDVFRGRRLWSTSRPAPAWFRRADHLGAPDLPLDECVRALVEERTGRRPAGAVRLLTPLRTLGHYMSPVCFYHCANERDDGTDAVVAEVSNTPWNERHCYVLPGGPAPGRPAQWRVPKTFHVSPFLPMNLEYEWHTTFPGDSLAVHIATRRDGIRDFDATLTLRRQEIDGRSLATSWLRFPLPGLQILAAIYWQALRIRLAGVPGFDHPGPERPVPGHPDKVQRAGPPVRAMGGSR